MADSTSSTSEHPTPQRSIAASIDSGLAGLLSSVLAHHREEPQAPLADNDDLESLFDFDDETAPETTPETTPEPTPEVTAEIHSEATPVTEAAEDEDLFGDRVLGSVPEAVLTPEVTVPEVTVPEVTVPEVTVPEVAVEAIAPPTKRIKGRLGPAPVVHTAVPEAQPVESQPVESRPIAPQIEVTPQVAAEAQDFASFPTTDTSAHDVAPITPESKPDSSHEPVFVASHDGPRFENNPVYDPGVQVPRAAPAPVVQEAPPAPKRLLTSLQIGLLLEGLSQLRARPGEDGLPPGMLLMDVRGPLGRYHNDSLYSIRAQIDAAVRGGDMALVAPDIGIVLFCGGLFFPGDLEVMGARLRRRALDANPSVSAADELKIVVAGALSAPGEDPTSFIHRGVASFDRSIDNNRQDIVIDYVDNRTYR